MPTNKHELEMWWSAYLAALAGGKNARAAKMLAIEALECYREASEYAGCTADWSS